MPRKQISGNLALADFEDIFQPTAPTAAAVAYISGRQIVDMPLGELYPPEFHPFHVNDGPEMDKLVRSILKYGIWEPGIVRPRADGAGTSCAGYELVSGNRRKRACEIAGIPTMPVIIREMDDDSAAIAMVDINLEQRKLTYSERAWAYRVKLEALNHRGVKSENPGELSVGILCEQTGEKKSQVYRLIQLTELVPALLDRLDTGTVKLSPALELAHLSRPDQSAVADCLAKCDMRPSLPKAKKLREAAQDGKLTQSIIESILTEPAKAAMKDNPVFGRFSRYFPDAYTEKQMENVISGLLEVWQRKRAG